MSATWIEIGGVAIGAPVTAGTNLLLAGQCLVYARLLSTEPEPPSGLWRNFFLMMAIATVAGAIKHGLQHSLAHAELLGVFWVTNLAGGSAVYFAQRATLASQRPDRPRGLTAWLPDAQLLAFLCVNALLGPRLLLLLLDATLGLLPVIAADYRASRHGHSGAGYVAGGLSFSAVAGVVYVAQVSAGAWLNHVDIAHLLMAVTFATMMRGTRGIGVSGSPRTPPDPPHRAVAGLREGGPRALTPGGGV